MTKLRNAKPWYANIWIAGDYEIAVDECRKFAMDQPCCVTVTPTKYVYTGGAEDGVLVRMINYPRFNEPLEIREDKALHLADLLLQRLSQWSYSVEFPENIVWYTTKE